MKRRPSGRRFSLWDALPDAPSLFVGAHPVRDRQIRRTSQVRELSLPLPSGGG